MKPGGDPTSPLETDEPFREKQLRDRREQKREHVQH